MHTDPVADFLTKLRNASRAGHAVLRTRSSNLIKAIADVLVKKHFLESAAEEDAGAVRELTVAFIPDREALNLKRMSKPGQRLYVGHKDIKRVRNGLGIALISTSHGVITDEEARSQKIGGEYICEVY